MKSMLHEASTVAKAIEKAWIESGKPLEFTINVLEVGEKNFLGMSKRPAIVSISYDPRRLPAKAPERRDALAAQRPPRQAPQRPRQEPQPRQEIRLRREQAPVDKAPARPRVQNQQPQQGQQQAYVDEHWTPELIDDAKTWFREMAQLLSIDGGFDVRADRRMLTVVFEKQIFQTPEEERQLFVGWSYLIIQFLKKKHKKKLRGYHLVINTKAHAVAEKPQ